MKLKRKIDEKLNLDWESYRLREYIEKTPSCDNLKNDPRFDQVYDTWLAYYKKHYTRDPQNHEKPKPKPKPKPIINSKTKAIAAILAVIVTLAVTIAFRKILYRFSKRLYNKVRILIDDLKKSGWAPGRQLTPEQRNIIMLAAQGIDTQEAKLLQKLVKKERDDS